MGSKIMFLSSGVQDARELSFPLPMRGVGLDECHLLLLASDHLVERRHQGPFVPPARSALRQMIEEGRDIYTLLVLNPERLQILATPKFNHHSSFTVQRVTIPQPTEVRKIRTSLAQKKAGSPAAAGFSSRAVGPQGKDPGMSATGASVIA